MLWDILYPILRTIIGILGIYQWILIARILLSWFVRDFYSNPLLRLLYQITEPVLARARHVFSFARFGMMDFSPIIVFLLLEITTRLLTRFMGKLYVILN